LKLPLGAADDAAAGCSYGERVDVGHADLGAVEAVCLVYFGEARVAWFDKGDVDAL